jgi:fructose-1-phosphate kinase PfkB-like protein
VIIAARKLSPLIPIQCISSVENGALLITKDHIWFGTIPNIKIQSTVGAGDSMVGAMAYVLGKHRGVIDETSSKEMLRYGLAAATATLACKGLTMGTKQSISQYLTKIGIKK